MCAVRDGCTGILTTCLSVCLSPPPPPLPLPHPPSRNSLHWPNGDGVDVESGTNITLTGLTCETGDDCIALRSGNRNDLRTPWPQPPDRIDPLQDVTIMHCDLRSSSAAIKIEALFQAAHGNISNVVIDNITILPGTNRGIGVWQRVGNPTRRDGGGGIRDIVVSNVRATTAFQFASAWWGSGEAIVITSVPETASQGAVGLPGIHNVSFINVSAVSDNGVLVSARDQAGTNTAPLTGISFKNVSISITRQPSSVSTWAQHDFRPVEDGLTPPTLPAPVDGMFFEHVTSVVLEGVAVQFTGQPQPYWDGPLVPGSGSGGRAGVCMRATPDSNVSVVGAPGRCETLLH